MFPFRSNRERLVRSSPTRGESGSALHQNHQLERSPNGGDIERVHSDRRYVPGAIAEQAFWFRSADNARYRCASCTLKSNFGDREWLIAS